MYIVMKLFIILSIVFVGCFPCVSAQRMNKVSQRTVKKAIEYEKRELKSVRDKLLIKKKEVLRSLKRLESRATSNTKRIISAHVKALEVEIGYLERLNKGNYAKDIVDFGAAYYFKVSVSVVNEDKKKISTRGKIVFLEGRKASVLLKDTEGKVVYDKKVSFGLDNNYLVLDCGQHGLVYVRRRNGYSREVLNLDWEAEYQVVKASKNKQQMR